MSGKSPKIASLIAPFEGHGKDAHYLGFFECFNQQLFFEAHEVLEELWLSERGGPRDLFFKGLIQLAGAFVHVQKGRFAPATALFGLAKNNLGLYPSLYEGFDTVDASRLIDEWIGVVNCAEPGTNLLVTRGTPRLRLQFV